MGCVSCCPACKTSRVPPDRDVAAFEARAAGYEHGWLGRLHHDIADRTADLALVVQPHPQRLLDVGCGTAYLLRSLASRRPDVEELAGVDPAASMIEVATASTYDERISFSVAVSPKGSPTPTTPPTSL